MTENDTLQNIADSLATEAPKVETQSSDLQNIADELSAPKQEEVKEEIVAEQKTEEIFNPEELKEIGVEIKSKSELKEFISSLKNENVTLKAKADEVYANEEIKKLNDYVKNGGDLKAYTNDVQQLTQYKQTLTALDSISPVEAYKYGILQQFGVKDVSELPEDKRQEFEDYIDSQPAFQKELEGRKLINAEKASYQAEINKIEQGITQAQENLARKNEAYATNVSKAIQTLTGVDGIKVKESEKAELSTILKNPKQALQDLMPLGKNYLPREIWKTQHRTST